MKKEISKPSLSKTKETSIFERVSKTTLSFIFYTLGFTALIASFLLIWIFYSYSASVMLNSTLTLEIAELIKNKHKISNSTNLMTIQNSQMMEYSTNQSTLLNDIKANITSLQNKIDGIKQAKPKKNFKSYDQLLAESAILQSKAEIDLIQNQAKHSIGAMCYSSTLHEFSPKEVRSRCRDDKAIVLYKNEEGDRFGGCSTIGWNEHKPRFMRDDKAFLFSLSNMLVFPVKANEVAVQNHPECFPSFGLSDIECCFGKCTSEFPSNYISTQNSLQELMKKNTFELKTLEVYEVLP